MTVTVEERESLVTVKECESLITFFHHGFTLRKPRILRTASSSKVSKARWPMGLSSIGIDEVSPMPSDSIVLNGGHFLHRLGRTSDEGEVDVKFCGPRENCEVLAQIEVKSR